MFVAKSKSLLRAAYVPSNDLISGVLAGSQCEIARLISRAEAEYEEAAAALAEIYKRAGRAHIIGVTGVPGGGKSALISELITAFSSDGRKVGVIAVDPSSPFSGGAILGDRLRMSESAENSQAFVRSMATRGHFGGLAKSTLQAADVLDAAGYSPIFIETVGVGQDEIEIVKAAHSILVVSAPGLGDDIQAIKAGVMEIADIHVVSKSDKPEAEATARALKNMMILGSDLIRSSWTSPILLVSSKSQDGIADLKHTIDLHWKHLMDSGELLSQQRAICKNRILATMEILMRREFETGAEGLAEQLEAVLERKSDPDSAARSLLKLGKAAS